MLDEARKREKIANAVLGTAMAVTAGQSAADFVKTGHVESPGVALMQMYSKKRKEADRNLDHGAISSAARNIKVSSGRNKTVKQEKKSLKEFMHLSEMRKEDKVKGKGRTPLYQTVGKKYIKKDETGHLKVHKSEKKVLSPLASTGRFKQGMKDPTNPYTGGSDMPGTVRHPHGGGGSGAKKEGILRGKKKVPGEKKPRAFGDGPTPAEKVANRRASKKSQDRMNRGRRAFEGFSNWRDDYSPLEIESFDLITNKPLQPTEGIGSKMLDEKCWPGYEKKGMKTMFGKRYPNCVKKKTRKEEVELEEGAFKNQYGKKGKLAQSSKRKSLGRGSTINPDAKDTGYESPAEFRTAEKRLSSYKEEVTLDEVTRREISLTANEDKKFKALLDKARKSKKKPDSNYKVEGGPVRTSKIESDYYARKKKFFNKEELELEEAKEAKSCPAGKYWCYDSKKCKTIPTGWYVGRGGYLEKEEETKKKNGNGNGDHDSNGGSDGGGSNGGGGGE